MKHTRQHVPEELKKSIVQEYLTTEVTQRELYERYNLRGKNINTWILKFGSELRGTWATKSDSMKKKTKVEDQKPVSGDHLSPQEELDRLKRENAALKAALDFEKLKNEALDTMISLAEEHFQIPIRKKSGAKQSKL